MQITVKFDTRKLQKELDRVRKGLADRASNMALNKTIAKARTESYSVIRSEYNIKQRDVAKRLRVLKAGRRRHYAVLEPRPGGRALNVRRFTRAKRLDPRRKRQLTFQIRRGKRVQIPGAFIGNKGRTVFRRVGHKRLPIEPVYTIGVPQMFGARRVRERVLARIRKEFPIEMDRAVRHVLRKGGK
jgi:hypothetical protein